MFFTSKEKINLEELTKILKTQKQTLIQKGVLEMLGKEVFEREIETAWKNVVKIAPNINFVKQGTIPLLLVVNFKNIQEGIEKIQGHTQLNPDNIKIAPSQGMFSVLLDVEDGQKMVAKSPKDALKKFEKEGRSALTINESISLLTYYPELLKNHYLISAGSFYTKENETLPLLWLLDEHHNPELHYAWFHIAHGSYGTASYAIKI